MTEDEALAIADNAVLAIRRYPHALFHASSKLDSAIEMLAARVRELETQREQDIERIGAAILDFANLKISLSKLAETVEVDVHNTPFCCNEQRQEQDVDAAVRWAWRDGYHAGNCGTRLGTHMDEQATEALARFKASRKGGSE